ncbi:MAG: 30S ribosomal protein S18 [Verrucomicrobiae bacterium]|nr:30S ribosomal protein S18 [Verrucomicrobiae bacterium]
MARKPRFSRRRRTPSASSRNRPDINLGDLDFRNIEVLKKFVTEHGRVLSRQYTNLPARFQRRLALAIKRARNALLIK